MGMPNSISPEPPANCPSRAPRPPPARIHPPKPWTMRTACKACRTFEGSIRRVGGQDVVRCAHCNRYVYCAPRAETAAAAQIEREGEPSHVRLIELSRAAPRMDIDALLAAMEADEADADGTPRAPDAQPASDLQRRTLLQAGFDLPRIIYRREAGALFQILAARRQRDLCSLRQAKLLRKHGLRTDASMSDAREAISAIARNDWIIPASLASDPRFREVEREGEP